MRHYQSKAPETTMTQFTLVETEPAASQQILPAGFPSGYPLALPAGFPSGYPLAFGAAGALTSQGPPPYV